MADFGSSKVFGDLNITGKVKIGNTAEAPTAAVNTNTTQLATTAFVLGQAGSVNPSMNGTVAIGTATKFAREDHVHPVDTSRAPASHGLHVPTTQAANNAVFLRNDNTWVTVTPANIGALPTAGGSMSGNITFGGNYGLGMVGLYSATRYQNVFSMGAIYAPATDGTSLNNMYGIAWTHTNVGGQSKAGLSHQALFVEAGVTKTAIGTGIWTAGSVTAEGSVTIGTGTNSTLTSQTNGALRHSNANGYIDIGPMNSGLAHIYTDRPAFYFNKDLQVNGNTVFHKGNMGHLSTLDADTLDTMQPSSTGGANTIVARDGNGYINNTWFNSSRGAENTTAAQYIYDTGDGYMRKKALANVQSEIVTASTVATALTSATITTSGKLTVSNDIEVTGTKNFIAPNNYGYQGKDSTGAAKYMLWMNPSNEVVVGYNNQQIVLDCDYPKVRGGGAIFHEGNFPYAVSPTYWNADDLRYAGNTNNWGGGNKFRQGQISGGNYFDGAYPYGAFLQFGGGTATAQIYMPENNASKEMYFRSNWNGTSFGWTRVLTDNDKASGTSTRGKVANIGGDGVMEIGKYIDFHDWENSGDYTVRLASNGSALDVIGELHDNGLRLLRTSGGNPYKVFATAVYCTSGGWQNVSWSFLGAGTASRIFVSPGDSVTVLPRIRYAGLGSCEVVLPSASGWIYVLVLAY